MSTRRKPTSTSSFGVGKRESHDSSDFYSRFTVPEITGDEEIGVIPPENLDQVYAGDSRSMPQLPDSSVALIVTSPPYFAGKEYETALGEGHIPKDYVDYLEMLTSVFEESARVLEPGGRIAVNVANLGRKPYRSLAADVVHILQDRLGLLLRGEIVWQKAHGAGGSCAWGSFQSAANPVLRDLTERVVVASKGRFDRALSRREREKRDLPSVVTIFKDDFMEATTDLWDIPPESANRVGHPAPFPVELPQRLIELYTYRGDVVVDPFCGSASTAVAALRSARHFVCYDTDEDYVVLARERIAREVRSLDDENDKRDRRRVFIPAGTQPSDDDEPYQRRAVREGQRAKDIARAVLKDCDFEIINEDRRFPSGVEVNFVARDAAGNRWFFDVSGAFTSNRAGLRRTDTLWKALGKGAVLKAGDDGRFPLVFLTTDLPPKGSAGEAALRAAHGAVFHDAIEMLSAAGQERLRAYASGEGYGSPLGDLLPAEDQDAEPQSDSER
jgi:site-specific DNA-methyltransferase (adenine-specific)